MRTQHPRRRHLIATAGASLAILLAASAQAGESRDTFAQDSYSQAVNPQELTGLRAGDLSVQGNANLTQFAQSDQTATGTSESNSITGTSIPAGNISLNGEAMSNVRGINNVVINTAAQAVVQGLVSLTVITNN